MKDQCKHCNTSNKEEIKKEGKQRVTIDFIEKETKKKPQKKKAPDLFFIKKPPAFFKYFF